MSATVPLVIYVDGKRIVIGTAEVEEKDGEVIAKGSIDKAYSDLFPLPGKLSTQGD